MLKYILHYTSMYSYSYVQYVRVHTLQYVWVSSHFRKILQYGYCSCRICISHVTPTTRTSAADPSAARVFDSDTPARHSLYLALRNSALGVVDVRRGPITSLHVFSHRCSPCIWGPCTSIERWRRLGFLLKECINVRHCGRTAKGLRRRQTLSFEWWRRVCKLIWGLVGRGAARQCDVGEMAEIYGVHYDNTPIDERIFDKIIK